MKIRKTLIFILIVIALFSFTACFDDSSQDSSSTPSDDTTTTSTYSLSLYDEEMNFIKKLTFDKATENTVSVDDFKKTGYTFGGIYDLNNNIMMFNAKGFQSPTVMLDGNYSAVLKYSPVSYQLVFDAGEGKLSDSSDFVKNICYGESVGLFPTPEYEGKNFDGWFDEQDNRFSSENKPVYTKFNSEGFVISGEIIKLHAKYTDKYCTVSLLYDDGSLGRQLKIKYGQKLPDMTEYYKDDGSRAVTGFGVSSAATVAYNDAVYTDLELYAIWQDYKNVNFVYTVDDTRVVKVVKSGNKAVLRDGEREGYTFDGWYPTELLTGNKITEVSFGSLAETYYAKWSIANYTVKFVADGKLVSSSEFNINESEIFVPPVPVKAHYTGKWEDYKLEYKNIIVNAIYDPDKVKMTLMSGSDFSYQTVVYGENFSLSVPKKKGYVFCGWYYNEQQVTDEKGSSLTPYAFDNDVTVTAKWEGIKCRLFFESNGGSGIDSVDVEYGKPYKLTQIPERNGFYFGGWFDETFINEYINEITLTENTIIYAKWIKSVAVGDADGLKEIALNPALNYHLTANINLKGEEWEPIQSFSGIFNGNGYKIYNFGLRKNGADSAFVIKNTGTIKNVTFANVEFSDKVEGSTDYVMSVVCGYNEGKILNVSAEKVNMLVNVTNYYKTISVGAIVGKNSSLVVGCSAQADLTYNENLDSGRNATVYLGGIVGQNLGEILNVETVVSFNATEYLYKYNATTRSYLFIGGAIGAQFGTMKNGTSRFSCQLDSNATSNGWDGATERYTYIGGIIGCIYENGQLADGYSSGSATFIRKGSSAGNYEFATGGVVGKVDGGTVDNCASEVSLTLKEGFGGTMGGVVGLITLKGRVSNTAYYGTVTTESFSGGYFGGLAGKVEGTLTKGYFHGKIVSESTQTADIVGYIESTGAVSKTIGNGNVKRVFVENKGSSTNNYIIAVDFGSDILYNGEKLFDELCMYEVDLWAIDENTGLYLISFPEKVSVEA